MDQISCGGMRGKYIKGTPERLCLENVKQWQGTKKWSALAFETIADMILVNNNRPYVLLASHDMPIILYE